MDDDRGGIPVADGERRLPLTYGECRARLRRATFLVGAVVHSHAIHAAGPDGEQLSVDVVSLGDTRPTRALVVLSGVHGVGGSSVPPCRPT